MGDGFYSWASESEAHSYRGLLEGHGASDLQIVRFDIPDAELASLRRMDLRTLSDAEVDAWMERYSHYGRAEPHGFDYVIRGTGVGEEHYFSREGFERGTCT